jgi:hypothetical protein
MLDLAQFSWTSRMDQQNICLIMPSTSHADRKRTLYLVLLLLFLGLVVPRQANAQKNTGATSTQLFRHHVIFLLDASGSIDEAPGSWEEYLSVIRSGLPALLRDPARNGFGVSIYDPKQDLSSTFVFGLSKQHPLFEPSLPDSFMRRIWFQEQGKTFDDLVKAAPHLGLRWTGINSAFSQSIRKARWEAEQWKVLDRAFQRTFVVIVSDGKANAWTDSLDEIRNIKGAAKTESGLSANEIEKDYQAANSFHGRLAYHFVLSPAGNDNLEKDLGTFEVGHYKLFLRELRPQRLVNLGELVEEGPDQETELVRRANGQYSGTLTVVPRRPESYKDIPYELVDLKFRLPGQSEYTSATASPDNPFVREVQIPDDDVDRATVDLQLSFVRRDQVYGQSVQVFDQPIRFRREPAKYVLGVIPITDLAMNLHPGWTQDEIQNFDSVVIIAALVITLFILGYIVLFPAPLAEMELIGDAAGPSAPLRVAFNRSGQQNGPEFVLRTLRFKNNAFRKLFGHVLPRLAERPFDIQVNVQSQFPLDVQAPRDRVVGMDADMHSGNLLTRQTQGSETTIRFSPNALIDYLGSPSDVVKCEFTVRGTQAGRRFGLWPFSRQLADQKQEFFLRFDPEEPDIRANLIPRLDANPTGTTDTGEYPAVAGVDNWIIWPHHRGRKDESGAIQDFDLEIINAATHSCSKSGAAKLNVVLYRADGKGKALPVVLDEAYQDVIQVDAHRGIPLSVPIWMPYGEMEPPRSIGGDDYVIEVTIKPAEGQQWTAQIKQYGVRVGPDPRTTALSFKVGTSDSKDVNEWRWQSFGSPAEGAVLRITPAKPVLWNVGKVKESSVFARIEIDNVARLGDGAVTLKLKPEGQVRLHATSEPGDEPIYAEGETRKIVRLTKGTVFHMLGEEVTWRLDNEARERPIRLGLEFRPKAITHMERQPPRFRYVCELPFECSIQETAEDRVRSFAFKLEVDFEVLRYSGDHALAIDFGTSAVVAAFEQDQQVILARHNDVSYATQNLQGRYLELVKGWQQSPDIDLRNAFDYETTSPNIERNTAFIPSALIMRENQQIGEADFVILPVSLMQMGRAWDRTVYYLKGLILRSDKTLAYHEVEGMVPLKWKDSQGTERIATRDPIKVDEIIRSAYRNLLGRYVKPLLTKQDKLEYLDRMVVSYPNNFTVSHIRRVIEILKDTFPEFRSIELLSESNAVAIYCARNATRFFREMPRGGESRHLLVYDIGAGTADITYTRLTWESKRGATKLSEMRVLFRDGIAVAGNRLDACLAKIVDEKIRSLVQPLRDLGITLEYNNPIVDPDDFNPGLYAANMLRLKEVLLRLKMEISTEDKPSYQVRLTTERGVLKGIATVSSADPDNILLKKLETLGISYRRNQWIGIPLLRDEIFTHPEVVRWLQQVTFELIRNLKGALSVLDLKPEIDTLILSGRTAQFPPLRQRLFEAINSTLGLEETAYYSPKLERNENKEAVALGCLLYEIFHEHDLRLFDQNVWAKYGIIYDNGTARKFKEFFSYASKVVPGQDEEDEIDGMRRVFFRRTFVIARAGGQIEIAATSSDEPDEALRDQQSYLDNFRILHKVGTGQLPAAGEVKISVANNRDDKITVIIDPDGDQVTVEVDGYLEDAHTVQLEWPYQPLSSKTTGTKSRNGFKG